MIGTLTKTLRTVGTGLLGVTLLSSVAQAQETFPVPPDAGVLNVRDFGAIPDDNKDDTAALRAAIVAAFGTGNRYVSPVMIYFPKGVYDVSETLEYRVGRYPTAWGDGWLAGGHFVGENQNETIIRLKDNCPGFGNAEAPKPVFKTGSEEQQGIEGQPNPDGWGNEAFRHYFRNLTIDVGRNNPGAVAIDYNVSNRGAIRNVTLKSSDGKGRAGIAMWRAWPGPGLIKNVTVDGFEVGIDMGGQRPLDNGTFGNEYGGHGQYGMTFENITLRNQTLVGMQTVNNVMAIRKLKSENRVPAIWTYGGASLLVLIDSEIKKISDGPATDAGIWVAGGALIRNLKSTGFSTVIERAGWGNATNVAGNATPGTSVTTVSEWKNLSALTQFSPNTGNSLNLPVEDVPEYINTDFSQWANVTAFGATPYNDSDDDGPAIQAALNSGKPVVYLPNGIYKVASTLTIPTSVRKIVGFHAFVAAKAPMRSVIRYIGTGTTVIEHVGFGDEGLASVAVEHDSTGTLAISHSDIGRYRTTKAGKTFTEDTIGRPFIISPGHRFWARQLNTEFGKGGHVVNNGGTVWILNQKTEGADVNLMCVDGQTELLGGLMYPLSNVAADTPSFDVINGRASFTYVTNGQSYANHVREHKGSLVRSVAYGRVVPLYVTGGTSNGVTCSFNDITADGFALNGIRMGIDFGSNKWAVDGTTQYAGFTKYAYFKNNTRSNTFTLPSGKYLLGLRVTSDQDGTYTVSDGVNPPRTGSYRANYPSVITTGWTRGGRTITVTLSTGWLSGIDDITYSR